MSANSLSIVPFSSSPEAQPYRQACSAGTGSSVGNAGMPFIVLGYVLMLTGRGVAGAGAAAVAFGFLLGVVGLLFHVGGCMTLAEAKGHSKWLGLLGLLTCFGLLILLVTPARSKQ